MIELMTPEIWTVLGTGFTLAALGITGFTLLWRYITRAEQRTRADLAAAEQRTRADLATAEKRNEARFGELKSDLATAEKRNEARFGELKSDLAAAEKRNEARFGELKSDLAAAEKRNEERFVGLGTRMHTLEVQMAKLEGLLEGLREAITGKARCVIDELQADLAQLWTAGTLPSRPGRKAHNCHLELRGGGACHPTGP